MSDLTRLDCRATFDRLSAYVDRELDESEVAKVSEHLERCAACAEEFDFEEQVIDEVRAKVRRISAPSGLMARISEALRSEH